MKFILFLLLLNISNAFECNITNDCNTFICSNHELEDSYLHEFNKFIIIYDRKYSNYEYENRYKIFKKNLKFISEYNCENIINYKYKLKINDFADKTFEEYKITLNKTDFTQNLNKINHEYDIKNYDSLDWRTLNNPKKIKAVTNIKNQGFCGSCWSFSAISSVESAFAISKNKITEFSEQQLVDCSIENGGCDGGNINLAFEYIIKNGICSSLSYPYTGVKQTCNLCNPVFKLNGYIDIPSGNESAILEQLNYGPVSVAIEADQLYFMFYSSGVFDGPCGKNVNHGVTIVGYGYEPSIDLDYWIVKNSWGLSWGEDGYIRVIRGVNICGIALFASRPY